MTLFTDNPFEKMMIQKPDRRRDNAPPVPYPPACASCPYNCLLYTSLADGFSAAFANLLPSLAPMDLLIGIFGAVLIRLIVYVKAVSYTHLLSNRQEFSHDLVFHLRFLHHEYFCYYYLHVHGACLLYTSSNICWIFFCLTA